MVKAVEDASKLIFNDETIKTEPVWKDADVMKQLKSLIK